MPRETKRAQAPRKSNDEAVGAPGPIKAGASIDLGLIVSVYGRAPQRALVDSDDACFTLPTCMAEGAWATEH